MAGIKIGNGNRQVFLTVKDDRPCFVFKFQFGTVRMGQIKAAGPGKAVIEGGLTKHDKAWNLAFVQCAHF